MLEELKKEVYEANMELVKRGVVIYTWGNASAIDEETGYVVIKPSGVDYDIMKPEDMVVVDLEGNVKEGTLNPSTDLLTHLELYKAYEGIKGVVHTHSTYAVSFAQAGCDIKAFGTTHADTFHGDVACTRELHKEEIQNEYEKNTGKVIVECLNKRIEKGILIDALDTPAILVKNHGPFIWGTSVKAAVYNAVVLEEVAKMAVNTLIINNNTQRISDEILDKHYYRKHGKDAYYGNNK